MRSFIGTSNCKMDAKYRIVVHSKFTSFSQDDQEKSIATLVANVSPDKCIDLFSEEAWTEVEEMLLLKFNEGSSKDRKNLSRFLDFAERLSIDNSGRITIPARMVEFAGLKKEVTLKGKLNKLQLWDAETYELMMKGNQAGFDDIVADLYGGQSVSD